MTGPRTGALATAVRPAVVTTRSELALARGALTGRVAVVMTMGALHDGHLELLRRARAVADHVVVTIFVNPLQFGRGEDFATYPRDLAADLDLLESAGGADVVFTPTEAVVYPDGPPSVRVTAGAAGDVLEGRARPGHFDGVLTVVTVLLHLTSPHVAVFGEKDAQQLALVRRLVASLGFAVSIEGVPTAREPDGLARSSRNVYLTPALRQAAVAVPTALRAALAAVAAGDSLGLAQAAAIRVLAEAAAAGSGVTMQLEYAELVHPDSFGPVPGEATTARLVLAVRVGGTRLIDNVLLSTTGPASSGGL